jgi:hypothetical protein
MYFWEQNIGMAAATAPTTVRATSDASRSEGRRNTLQPVFTVPDDEAADLLREIIYVVNA